MSKFIGVIIFIALVAWFAVEVINLVKAIKRRKNSNKKSEVKINNSKQEVKNNEFDTD